jgi:hypothetical protein
LVCSQRILRKLDDDCVRRVRYARPDDFFPILLSSKKLNIKRKLTIVALRTPRTACLGKLCLPFACLA